MRQPLEDRFLTSGFGITATGPLRNRSEDRVEHHPEGAPYFIVPKSEHPVAFGFKKRRTRCIAPARGVEAVLAAVDLDDQLCVMAAEVDDESADRNLPAEVAAINGHVSAKRVPKPALGGCEIATQPIRLSALVSRDGFSRGLQLNLPDASKASSPRNPGTGKARLPTSLSMTTASRERETRP